MAAGESYMVELPEDDLETYRTLTPWALVSLLLGLLSALALLSPLLWILPLGAVVSAGIALSAIHAYAPRIIGRNLALVGLALGLIFGVTAPTRLASRDYWLKVRAKQAVDEWLAFLNHGEGEKAYMVSVSQFFRQPLDASLAHAIQSEPETQRQYNDYLSHPDIKALLDARGTIQVISREATVVEPENNNDVVACKYEIHLQHDGQTMEMTIYTSVECSPDRATAGETVYRVRSGEYVAPRPVATGSN